MVRRANKAGFRVQALVVAALVAIVPSGSAHAKEQQPQSQVPAQYRPPCPIPREMFLAEAFRNWLALYDMPTMRPVCIIQLPDGPPATFTVSQDGRIFVAVRSTKMTDFSTDAGHVDIIGPDGRLLHRFSHGIVGPWDIAVDRTGRNFFLYSDGDMTLNGAEAGGWTPKLGMYDADTGALLRTYPLDPDPRAYNYFTVSPNGQTIDVFYSGKRARVETLNAASGALLRTAPVPKNKPPREIGGVIYRDDVRAEAPSPGSNMPFDSVTTITRTVKASGQKLPPIVIRLLLNGYDVAQPDPNLARATPGPEVQEPVFSSGVQIRRSISATARGVQFDDSLSGARYTYLGEYGRADDPKAHAIRIVDCARGIALIADTRKRTYVVRRMDPTTLTEQPSPRPRPEHMNVPTVARTADPRIKPDISYAVTPLTRSQLHSPLAVAGYAGRFDYYPMGRVFGGQTVTGEFEYADMPAPYPSCVNHPFGGEPLAITPQTLPMMSDAFSSLDPQVLPFVRRSGAIPQYASKKFLVYMAQGNNRPLKAMFDVRVLRRISISDISLFAPPQGYVQERVPQY